ncbi:methyltransferase domain-containing protein [Actinocrinis puniceicyclus]|uniref:Methyltransferase domain-containing protein n=1 Tax=Actinocrinis puniceicyclus TaxID=977794 RepID=A0A8J7WL36_9ACTN|nr:methyltransferase domain-containing protein [Actinocrinis puniceicyclus]MBS2964336.1 methyltransferase domain-containing protein [Actinocrinis puniceicyclus]
MPGNDAAYTHGHHESVLRSHTWRTAENSAAYLLPHLAPGMTVLDIGCGPGTVTAGLAALVDPGRVVAIDTARPVLEQAAAHAAAAAVGDRIEFAVGDVHELGFEDDSFDVVHAHQVLQHVGDPVGALREMRRVCRPGGIVAVRDSDYRGFFWHPQVPGLDDWMRLYVDLARANGGTPDAGRYLLAWAHAAGFEHVTASSSTWCYADEQTRPWWGRLWADRVVQSDFARGALAKGLADEQDLRAQSAAWLEWGAHPDGFISLVHGEILCRA